jgi:hypothetical protein
MMPTNSTGNSDVLMSMVCQRGFGIKPVLHDFGNKTAYDEVKQSLFWRRNKWEERARNAKGKAEHLCLMEAPF